LPQDPTGATNEWLKPPLEQRGLKHYLETLRGARWVVLGIFLLVTAIGVISVITADRVYEAEADLLVIPVPADETVLRTLGLIPESSDPALDVETAAELIDTQAVAARAAAELGGGITADDVLADVRVDPLPESNIVAVVGSASSATDARDLANAYADAAVAQRTDDLHARIDDLLPRLQAQLETAPEGDAATELASEVAQLQTLRTQQDPTLRFETPATAPESPVSPRTLLTILGSILAGLALGIAVAVALRVLDPRLRREDQLRGLFGLPILARIPIEPRAGASPLSPEALSPPTREAYRTLRAMLAAGRPEGDEPQSILITSATPSEGKTTTAINLAVALSLAGRRVILIEADLRRPSIGRALGLNVDQGVVKVLLGEETLEDSLVRAPRYGTALQVLFADYAGSTMVELFSLPAATRLIDRAQSLADCVIVDSPPLTEVIDALPFARRVDEVLVVVRLGKTDLNRLKELGELLAGSGIRPAGFALLGVPRTGRGYYAQAPRAAAPPARAGAGRRLAQSGTRLTRR
jgi:succinoglycan biosynthesis transport protein ExoP